METLRAMMHVGWTLFAIHALSGLLLVARADELPAPPKAVKIETRDDSFVIPLRKINHMPWLQIEASGRKWEFILDTGAGVSFGTPEFLFATAGTTNSSEHFIVLGSHDDSARVNLMGVPLMKIGSKNLINMQMAVADLSTARQAAGATLDGVMGLQPFPKMRLTIDYAAGQFTVDPADATSLSEDEGLPYTLRLGTPHITLRLQGHEIEFVIDTGASGSLALPASKMNLKFVSPPRAGRFSASLTGIKQDYYARLAGSLRIAGIEFIEPTVTSMPDDSCFIGGQILEHFTLIFDTLRQRVHFVPLQSGAIRLPSIRSSGLGFDRAVTPWNVLFVLPDSPAVTRQIHPGDRCVRVNGEPVSAWSPDRYADTVDQTNELHLTFVRDTKEFEVAVPVYVQVP